MVIVALFGIFIKYNVTLTVLYLNTDPCYSQVWGNSIIFVC